MIRIVDSIMGTGKTTWALDYINSHSDKSFLCVVPTLTEVERFRKSIKARALEPKNWGRGKYQEFIDLIKTGENIVTTHSLIRMMDSRALELLRNKDYILIIDESLDVLEPFPLTSSDMNTLFDDHKIDIDADGYLSWQDEEYEGRFSDIKNLCEIGALMGFRHDDGRIARIVMWCFPPSFFECFKEGFVLTYLWQASVQKTYFELHEIPYELMMLNPEGDRLIPFDTEQAKHERQTVTSLLKICENERWNLVGKRVGKAYPLSKNWYRTQVRNKRKDKSQKNNWVNLLKQIKSNTENFFRSETQTKAEDNMYTVFEDFKEEVSGRGFKKDYSDRKDEKERRQSNFVACNARGTNDFRHKKALAYLVDFHANPDVATFLDHYNINFNDDAFALANLLQWIWRSAIRDGEEVEIYIPSERMRKLLTDWKNCVDL